MCSLPAVASECSVAILNAGAEDTDAFVAAHGAAIEIITASVRPTWTADVSGWTAGCLAAAGIAEKLPPGSVVVTAWCAVAARTAERSRRGKRCLDADASCAGHGRTVERVAASVVVTPAVFGAGWACVGYAIAAVAE